MHTTDKHIILWSINIFCGIKICTHLVGAYMFSAKKARGCPTINIIVLIEKYLSQAQSLLRNRSMQSHIEFFPYL